jgi:hypothetical protein
VNDYLPSAWSAIEAALHGLCLSNRFISMFSASFGMKLKFSQVNWYTVKQWGDAAPLDLLFIVVFGKGIKESGNGREPGYGGCI